MRILVLGGTRFIGPRLVVRLVASGHEVAVFHRGQTAATLPPSVQHLHGDRRQLAAHAAAFRTFAPDVVVDTIAFTERDAQSLVATFRGLAGRSVVVSSGDVYRAYGVFTGLEAGPPDATPLREDSPLRQALYVHRPAASGPDDPYYNYEKILVERVALGDAGLPCTVLRLPMVYGPGDEQHRLAPYLRRMADGRRVIPLDEGLARWRCLRGYVADVAAAVARAATDARAAGRVYNVAEPTAFTEAEWVARIGEAAGWGGRVVAVPRGRLPVAFRTEQDLVTDTTRIRAELGYREVTAPEDALRQTVAWERAHLPEPPPDYAAEDAVIAELGH
jgi:nucleoside-diphosphate-sugar epimerase